LLSSSVESGAILADIGWAGMRVVLGCGNFGGIGSAPAFFGRGESREEALAVMDSAWALGLRWFDTADAYGGGRSETWIGDWIEATGHRPRITTKTFNPMEDGADRGLSPARVQRQVAASLERLRIDRIDLYLAHEPDPKTPPEETIGTFAELAEEGLIERWGVSNVDTAGLHEWLEHGTPSLVQNSYSLLDRKDDEEVIPLCREKGIEYQAFSPLAGGWLTGKYRRDETPPAGSRMTMRPEPYLHLDDDRVYAALEALEREADARGLSTAGLALAWVLGGASSLVVGPRRPGHLDPVPEAVALTLSPRERDEVGSLIQEPQ
jgi:aryl-alcohol dehydrogenase-like predicted oxidoreductase